MAVSFPPTRPTTSSVRLLASGWSDQVQKQMPSRQADGDGDPLGEGLEVPLGLVEAGPVGDPLDPPLGVLDPPPLVGLAGELVLGWADGLVEGFFAACVLVAPVVAALLGPAAPLAGADVRDTLDEPGEGPVPVAPLVAVPAGDWFAAGVPLNAPETSSATRPALATAATPTATTPARLRGVPCDWSC